MTPSALVTLGANVAREAFQRPELEYYARTQVRHIPGYNSMRFIRLILALETEFAITLLEDDVDHITTMGDIVALLRARTEKADRSS